MANKLTLFDVPDLVKKRLPDALFENLRDVQGASVKVNLVPEPRLSEYLSKKDSEQNDVQIAVVFASDFPTSRSKSRGRRHRKVAPDPPSTLESIFESLSHGRDRFYNPRARTWRDWPKTGMLDTYEFVVYLNGMVGSARRHLNNDGKLEGLSTDRLFILPSSVSGPWYTDQRYPDLVVVTKPYSYGPYTWKCICAIGALRFTADDSLMDVSGYMAEHARLCFKYQPDRRFVLGLSLIDVTMHLWKFDRSGILASASFDVHENPLDFLRIVLGIALGGGYYLGLDPSLIWEGNRQTVQLNGKEYTFIRTIQLNDRLSSRGTSVHLVEDNESGEQLVVKDQWVERSLDTKEIDLYKVLMDKNVQKVSRLVDHQFVHYEVDGKVVPDTTEYDRASVEHQSVIRDHYRLLISPYGDALDSFRSLKELVSVFKDYVEAIWDLYKVNVLHHDITPRNLIIVEGSSSTRRGYIIDFDIAVLLSHSEDSEPDLNGTLPFMATEMLINYGCVHKYYHDLESLFYALIFICHTEGGPRKYGPPEPRHCSSDSDCAIKGWFTTQGDVDTLRCIGLKKYSIMSSAACFELEILTSLRRYFKPLEGLLKNLRRILFKSPEQAGGDLPEDEKPISERKDVDCVFKEFMHAFEATLGTLPDADES